jgi:ribosomal protein S18 acetylase RimI-like enzyme
MTEPDTLVEIRAATRADIPAVVWCSTTSTTPEEDAGFGRPRSERAFCDEGRLATVWRDPNLVPIGQAFVAQREGEIGEVVVAERKGEVVGCVVIADRGEALELHSIDIPRDRQRRGVGRQIVRLVEARARARGKRAVTLGTSRNAEGIPWKSLPWWLSLGYRITGEEENDWTRRIGSGVREIRMRKELD